MITIVATFLIGLFAGFINVIVGSGSSVTVPALIFLGLPPHMAIGTNRFAMLFNNLTGAVGYHLKKRLKLKVALIFSITAVLGALIGSNLVLLTSSELLKQIIGAVLLIEMLVIFLGKNKFGITQKALELTNKHYILGSIFGLLVGLYGGFIGMGMTSILIFLLVIVFSFGFIESAAIAKVMTFFISLAASIVFLIHLQVDVPISIALISAYIIGGYLGVHSAVKMGDVRVRILFMIVVFASAIKSLFF